MKVDWLKAKIDYIKDETYTLSDVAAKYGIDYGHLRNVAGQEKWVELRDEIKLKSDKRLTEIVSETIAQVNIRHAGIGKALQGIGLEAIKGGLRPNTFKDARLAVINGVSIEREALGIKQQEVKDEIYQKFQQFAFIFTLKEDELKHFIRSLDQELANRRIIESADIVEPISEDTPQLNDYISESSVRA